MLFRLLATFALLVTIETALVADERTDALELFETSVRPLLADNCFHCHGARAKALKGGLHLDSRAGIVAGGDSGPAIIAGDPDKSRLVRAIRYEGQAKEMPPDGKLAPAEIDAIVKWIELGAPWPESDAERRAPTDAGGDYDWARLRREHWAFRPVSRPIPPKVGDAGWPRNAVDRFVLARLEAARMRPAPEADRVTLLRRLFADLIGLPPAPDVVAAFVNDDRPDAYERIVDDLLASPRYGERWARHWLDVARYSDGMGAFVDGKALPHAYRFRDWVVRALNRDLPYDDFVRLQIAGDLLLEDSDDGSRVEDHVAATGFFALGPEYTSDGGDPDSIAQARSETLDDRVDTLTRGLLALTAACARCHDHKFDPIPSLDYYALAGVFNNTKTVERPVVGKGIVDRFDRGQAAIKEQAARIKSWLAGATKRIAAKTMRDEAQVKKQIEALLEATGKKELAELRAELERRKREAPAKYPVAHALADSGSGDMRVALRGNLRKPGPVAPRRFLRILASADSPRFTRGSGRLGLAEAVADARNPLTARVFVNRVWMHHFGRALVRTPSNFGALGEKPSHPDLLDWLASELVRGSWSIKALHRVIVTSSAYRMAATREERNYSIDGDNRLIWRMNPRRLDVESWRDALLAVSGELDLRIGGPPTKQLLQSRRRTLYSAISRNGDKLASDEFLRLFDFPAARVTSAKRVTSTVPQQYLFMLNNEFMVSRARAFAHRLEREARDDRARVERAYHVLYGRSPTEAERRIAEVFLDAAPESAAGEVKLSPWEQYAQTLLSTNEFLYIR